MFKKYDHKIQFFAIVVTCALISSIPVLNWPFNWVFSYFYEISQGISAIMTGGSITSLNLHLNGTAECTWGGGIYWLPAGLGFPGVAVLSIVLYFSVLQVNTLRPQISAAILGIIITLSLFLYARDIITALLLIGLLGAIGCTYRFRRRREFRIGAKTLVIYLMVHTILTALRILVSSGYFADAALLTTITKMPPMVFLFAWGLAGMLGLQYIWRFHRWFGW